MQKENLTPISTREPTYWPSDLKKLPDLIDFAVIKGIDKKRFTAQSCFDLSSDHSPIIIEMNSQAIIKQTNYLPHNYQTNWSLFKEILNEKITCDVKLKSAEDLENVIEDLNIKIHEAITLATPQIISEPKIQNISHLVREKIKTKRKLRKIWQKYRTKQNKKKLNFAIKDLQSSIHKEINDGIQNYLEKRSPTKDTNYSLWQATKKINRPLQFIAPIKKKDGTWARKDREKADLFAEHLQKVFEPANRTITEEEEAKLLNNSELNATDEKSVHDYKFREINNIIRNLKIKKSPGYDSITAKMLRELPPKVIRFITIIMNATISFSTLSCSMENCSNYPHFKAW